MIPFWDLQDINGISYVLKVSLLIRELRRNARKRGREGVVDSRLVYIYFAKPPLRWFLLLPTAHFQRVLGSFAHFISLQNRRSFKNSIVCKKSALFLDLYRRLGNWFFA
ncbi:MAG: hypothetical protein V3V33_08520 [Candidatus Lokiarchaeia archaeon]